MSGIKELHAPHLPAPPSERWAWALAGTVCATGAVFLILVLTGLVGRSHALAPPAVPVVATTPAATSAALPAAQRAASGTLVGRPSAAEQRVQRERLTGGPEVHISRRWMEGFYPIYETAQRTFGVDWLLLASIHMQESAFSTAPGTYHGLNFARCCGGPMQFNVTNGNRRGSGSTWDLVSDSYIYGRRPASYDHATSVHPSIYDDFDAIMAAAHLLSADGAGSALDVTAWDAAYDYYGHDETGVLYADEVLARAIGWSQHGFCINCGVRQGLVEAVHAAYGAPVEAALVAEARAVQRSAVATKRRRAPARRLARQP
ncbi:MAG TPA: hypothetical protein VHT27_09255 [Solirubrobacteraceae bacterium]|nr:hypothetical protein [Solirubrobacteraceae bacterium]